MPIDALLVGAGNRGNYPYGQYALNHPEELNFKAVVEPNKQRREHFAEKHNIPKENRFEKSKYFIDSDTDINIAFNASGDKKHLYSTIPLLDNDISVLLEKPIAITPQACVKLYRKSKKSNARLLVAHGLRYTKMFSSIKEVIKQGKIGRILAIEHEESIGDWHFAHSYVRGNWRNKEVSAPITLTKTSHDFDLLYWINEDDELLSIESQSDPLYFRKENAPTKTPKRCSEKCPVYKKCPYYAPRVYLEESNLPEHMKRAVDVNLDKEKIREKLKTGPYGRCVYHCDNDVPDFIKTTLKYKSGIRAHFKMTARREDATRRMRIIGTKGRISCDLIKSKLIINSLEDIGKIEIPKGLGMHGGGDEQMIRDFLDVVTGKDVPQKTSIGESLESHLMAFAAEKSRLSGLPVDYQNYKKQMFK